jgi:hypothetical protein
MPKPPFLSVNHKSSGEFRNSEDFENMYAHYKLKRMIACSVSRPRNEEMQSTSTAAAAAADVVVSQVNAKSVRYGNNNVNDQSSLLVDNSNLYMTSQQKCKLGLESANSYMMESSLVIKPKAQYFMPQSMRSNEESYWHRQPEYSSNFMNNVDSTSQSSSCFDYRNNNNNNNQPLFVETRQEVDENNNSAFEKKSPHSKVLNNSTSEMTIGNDYGKFRDKIKNEPHSVLCLFS